MINLGLKQLRAQVREDAVHLDWCRAELKREDTPERRQLVADALARWKQSVQAIQDYTRKPTRKVVEK